MMAKRLLSFIFVYKRLNMNVGDEMRVFTTWMQSDADQVNLNLQAKDNTDINYIKILNARQNTSRHIGRH